MGNSSNNYWLYHETVDAPGLVVVAGIQPTQNNSDCNSGCYYKSLETLQTCQAMLKTGIQVTLILNQSCLSIYIISNY